MRQSNSIPKGSQLLAPGRCDNSAPGVTVIKTLTIPEGSQHLRGVTCCDPSGITTSAFFSTPGALLRSDPGLQAWIPSGSGIFALLLACSALLMTQTGCPLATETGGGAVVSPPAAQVLAQAAAEKPAAAQKEEPKKVNDSNPDKNRRPKADRTPRKPGDPIKITFDNIILGMQADIPFRPWMLNEDVKELEGKRVSITGVMHGSVLNLKKIDQFILLRNKECKYGPGGQADHLAEVKMKKDQTIAFAGEKTVRVEGNLRIEPKTGEDGNTWSLYILDDATATVQ